MKYISTRGAAPVLGFDDVLLAGLARDGGLYVPESWPRFDRAAIKAMRGLSYAEVATRVMLPFVGKTIKEADFAAMVEDAYKDFGHSAVAPLKQMAPDVWVMELFHGPTLAFKDYALQLVGRLFDHVLTKRGEKVTIVGATSGDTGSAAIEACRDRDAIEIFILHPKGRVSEVQRRQMTTVLSDNVHNIALEGHFDDCQDMVKALFGDLAFRDKYRLSAVNSINWARIMAQIAYYFYAAIQLGGPDRPISFSVPTGNFGNIFAAYAAKNMGLPIDRLIVGSNSNDILTRYLTSGVMAMEGVQPTYSPSMDIQVSSNFERLLFDVYGRDGTALSDAMTRFRKSGTVNFGKGRWQKIIRQFQGFRLDNDQTLGAIKQTLATTGELLDPHSVIGYQAALAQGTDGRSPVVALATAHPAKFPDAVKQATGVHPALPERMSDLFDRPERLDVLANDIKTVGGYIEDRLAKRGRT